jgi:hypothetical protein
VLSSLFVTAANKFLDAFGEKATEKGPKLVENGEPGTDVKSPVFLLTEYTETVLFPKFVTAANKFPDTSGEKATEKGKRPVENGEPGTGLKSPVFLLTEYTETVLSRLFATAANKFPHTFGEKATEIGSEPVENGEPGTGVKSPVVLLTEYTETVLLPRFVTAANTFPHTSGEKATEEGLAPVENGDPLTGVKKPVFLLTEYTETVLSTLFATAANKFLHTFGEKAIETGSEPVANGDPETCSKVPTAASINT